MDTTEPNDPHGVLGGHLGTRQHHQFVLCWPFEWGEVYRYDYTAVLASYSVLY
jgi:hypothetical protein